MLNNFDCHRIVMHRIIIYFSQSGSLIADFLKHFCGMFNRLKNKWHVGSGRIALILLTFALGGSLCGYAGRKILALAGMEKGILWVILYIVLVVLLWPMAVILVSMLTGQFGFFKNYIQRVSGKMLGVKRKKYIRIAIFASGTGSNAERIIETLPDYWDEKKTAQAKVAVIITDNPAAKVISIAEKNHIPVVILLLKNKTGAEISEAYLTPLRKYSVDFIVLAGYLKMIPAPVIKAYPKKILNIHPALLPKYGGAGMYGNRVHEAVLAAGEKESGISIHFVDEIYDHGEVLFSAACRVDEYETAASLAEKVHELEHRHYPGVIARELQSQNPR